MLVGHWSRKTATMHCTAVALMMRGKTMHLHDVPQISEVQANQCPLPICHQELLETGQEKAGHSRCPAIFERWQVAVLTLLL